MVSRLMVSASRESGPMTDMNNPPPLPDFYHCDFYSRHYRKAGAYMNILAHANPQLRILEVGAGTGSATSKVLPFLVDSEGLQDDQMVRYVI